MRHFVWMLLLLSALCVPAPAWAQSEVLKQLWIQTNALFAAGKYAEAEISAKKALDLAHTESGANSTSYATSLNNLGLLYDELARYAEAERLDQLALDIREKAFGPNHPDVAQSLNSLAYLYEDQGHYAKAMPLAKRALAIREKVLGPNHVDVAQSLNTLALLYDDQGRYAAAEPLYMRALAIREKELGPDHPDVATSLNYLGLLYYDQGRYADAEQLDQRALAIQEKALSPDHPDVAQSLNNLAELYRMQRRYNEAGQLHSRALAIREKALGPDHPDVAQSLNNLALLYFEGGYAEAELLSESYYKRALAIWEKAFGPDYPDFATGLNNLALLYVSEHRYTEAEKYYKRALKIDRKVLGPDHPDISRDLNNLARLYSAQNRYGEAVSCLKRALAIDEKALGPDHPDLATHIVSLAAIYYRQGRYAEALPFIRRAATITAKRASSVTEESKGEQSEWHSRRYIFLGEVAVTARLIAASDPRTARLQEEEFAALQWSKASDTAAAVSHMAARFADGGDDLAILVSQRQHMQDQLDANDAMILKAVSRSTENRDSVSEAKLRDEEDSLRENLKKLDARMPSNYAELVNPRPLTIGETQNLLAPDQAMIVFAVGFRESYVGVVSHNDYKLDIVPVGSKALSDAVKTLRFSLDPPDGAPVLPPFPATTAYTLYRQLLAPAEPMLQGVTQLYVVTDGALESLPLGVLLTTPPASDQLSGIALGEAPWLVKRYAMSVLPSVSSLKTLRLLGASKAKKPFMGIGNPALNQTPDGSGDRPRGIEELSIYRDDRAGVDQAALMSLPDLPETENELKTEAQLLQAGSDSLLLGPNATVTAVLHADLASRRVIAFATHGLLAGDVGNAEPGLVMTPPGNMVPPRQPTEDDDGVLKASQIARLSLDADFVILAACNTAGSDGTPGAEGLSGLAKAFFYARARNLVVSHWSARSEPTAELMDAMQAAIKLGPARALQQAEIKLIANPFHAHPQYWAPFVVVGEGGSARP